MMRGEPGHRRLPDVAGRDAGHFAERLRTRARRRAWDLDLLRFPLARVPHADVAAPIVDRYIEGFAVEQEGGRLIALRRRENVDPSRVFRQCEFLALRDDCARKSATCWWNGETHAFIVNLVGQCFGGDRRALRIETRRGLEAVCRADGA